MEGTVETRSVSCHTPHFSSGMQQPETQLLDQKTSHCFSRSSHATTLLTYNLVVVWHPEVKTSVCWVDKLVLRIYRNLNSCWSLHQWPGGTRKEEWKIAERKSLWFNRSVIWGTSTVSWPIYGVGGVRGKLSGIRSSLPPCGSWDWTQVVRLGSRCL